MSVYFEIQLKNEMFFKSESMYLVVSGRNGGTETKIKFMSMSRQLPREIWAKACSKNETPLFNLYAADTSH